GRIAEVSSSEIGKSVRPACWRWRHTVKVGRHHAPDSFRMRCKTKVEIDVSGSRVAGDHLEAVKGKRTHTVVDVAWLSKLVIHHVVAVRPYAKVWIIRKLRTGSLEGIKVVGAG